MLPVSFQSKYIHICKFTFHLGGCCQSLNVTFSQCTVPHLSLSLCFAVPLYQDYCLRALKDDLNRLNKSLVSELITPLYLQGLQSPLSRHKCSGTSSPIQSPAEATPSSSPTHPIRVTPCTLWQDLDEVKASGLLRRLTSRQIRLQEV